jgi:hypothetical protein
MQSLIKDGMMQFLIMLHLCDAETETNKHTTISSPYLFRVPETVYAYCYQCRQHISSATHRCLHSSGRTVLSFPEIIKNIAAWFDFSACLLFVLRRVVDKCLQ